MSRQWTHPDTVLLCTASCIGLGSGSGGGEHFGSEGEIGLQAEEVNPTSASKGVEGEGKGGQRGEKGDDSQSEVRV